MAIYALKTGAILPNGDEITEGSVLEGGKEFQELSASELRFLLTEPNGQVSVEARVTSQWLLDNVIPGRVDVPEDPTSDLPAERALIAELMKMAPAPAVETTQDQQELQADQRRDENSEPQSIEGILGDADPLQVASSLFSESGSGASGSSRRSTRPGPIKSKLVRATTIPKPLGITAGTPLEKALDESWKPTSKEQLRRGLHRVHMRWALHGPAGKTESTGSRLPYELKAWLANHGLGKEQFQEQNDLMGFIQTIHDSAVSGKLADPYGLFAPGQWDGPGSIVFGLMTALTTCRVVTDKKASLLERGTAGATGIAILGKGSAHLAAAIQCWSGHATVAAQTSASVFGIVAGMISVGAGIWRQREIHTVRQRFQAVLELPELQGELGRLTHDDEYQYLQQKISQKLGSRTWKNIGGMAGTTAGIIGSVIATVGIFGVATAPTPFGWALLGVAVAGGLGLEGYRFARHKYKKRKMTIYRASRTGADKPPDWVRTTGEWHRFRIVHAALRIIRNPYYVENNSSISPVDREDVNRKILRGRVLAWILCGGENVSIEDAQERAVAMGYAGLMAFIKG